jgi:hypothetical protein
MSPLPLANHSAGSGYGARAGRLRHLLAPTFLLALLLAGDGTAQPPEPAAVGRDRPLTSSWLCENERSVLLNVHPRRRMGEAWLTYGGTRVAVERQRSASGITFESRDGKVKWHETGAEATLEFAGLLGEPIVCRRQDRSRR